MISSNWSNLFKVNPSGKKLLILPIIVSVAAVYLYRDFYKTAMNRYSFTIPLLNSNVDDIAYSHEDLTLSLRAFTSLEEVQEKIQNQVAKDLSEYSHFDLVKWDLGIGHKDEIQDVVRGVVLEMMASINSPIRGLVRTSRIHLRVSGVNYIQVTIFSRSEGIARVIFESLSSTFPSLIEEWNRKLIIRRSKSKIDRYKKILDGSKRLEDSLIAEGLSNRDQLLLVDLIAQVIAKDGHKKDPTLVEIPHLEMPIAAKNRFFKNVQVKKFSDSTIGFIAFIFTLSMVVFVKVVSETPRED